MPTIINALFDGVRPQYLDTLGGLKPLAGGRLIFCNAGTSTPKAIYSNAFDRLTPLTNPLILDADGYVPEGGVWLGDGTYKVFWQRRLNPDQMPEAWGDLWETDNILGVNTALNGSDGLNVVYLDTVSDLQNLDPAGIDLIGVTGYYTPNDFGGVRWFKWYEASAQTADNGMIFARTAFPAIGRFIGVLNGTDYIPASWYGATSAAPYPVNSRLLALQTYCANNKKTMFLQGGTHYLDNDLTLNINGDLILDVGVVFRREASAPPVIQINITPLGLNINGAERINYSSDELIKVMPITPIDLLPEWWGGNLNALASSGSKGRVIFTQSYSATGTASVSLISFECYFKTGTYISSTLSAGYTVSFGKISCDDDAKYVFRQISGEAYPFRFYDDFYARLLLSDYNLYTDSIHQTICRSASANGTRIADVIYDFSLGLYENTTKTNYTNLVNVIYSKDDATSLGTNTRYKLYANSFDGSTFVNQSNPIQPVPNGDLLVSWYDFRYGANSTQSANNANIFYELTWNAVENGLMIDGEGLAIKFDGNTSPQISGVGDFLEMKNMNLHSNYIVDLKTTTIGNAQFQNVSILDSKLSCTIKFLEGDGFLVTNCQFTYGGIECDDNVYISNNRFYGSAISNSTGINVHILNNYYKAQVNDTSFIYIGATLEPQNWEVKGNTFIPLNGGVAKMINVGARTSTIFNSLITCSDNFGGYEFDTKISYRGVLDIVELGAIRNFPITRSVYFCIGAGTSYAKSYKSLTVQKQEGSGTESFYIGHGNVNAGGWVRWDDVTDKFYYVDTPSFADQEAIVTIEFSAFY